MRAHPAVPAPETSSRIPVDIRRFPWIRRLAADYAGHRSALAPFFAGDPSDRAAWSQAIARAAGHPRNRSALVRTLAAQQAARGAPAASREATAQLGREGAVAILTGQQAGLFGGPLYTLLKALTAIKLADDVTRDHGVPAIAVFWVDSEDHDWDEVRSCPVFDDQLDVKTASLARREGPDVPVARTRLDASISTALDELAGALAPTEFRSELVARLREIYVPGIGMAEAFARWLEALLGERGLVVFDASDPSAKPLAAQVFARELAHPGETGRLAARAGAELVAMGYHAQVEAQPGQAALFRLGDDGTRHVVRSENGRVTAGAASFDEAAVVEEARTHPERFSPGVLLRPIVQDTLFPTACYVAGPSELAYLAQLRAAYEAFGVPMPLVRPRASATIADAAAFRFLTKYDVPFEALQPLDDAALNALLAAQIPPAVEQAFASAGERLKAALGEIADGVATIDATLRGAAESTLGRMEHDLQNLHGKMIAAAKRRDDTLRRQFGRTRALAFPEGRPQERAVGFVSFLNQYGPAFVARLDEELPLDLGVHWVVMI